MLKRLMINLSRAPFCDWAAASNLYFFLRFSESESYFLFLVDIILQTPRNKCLLLYFINQRKFSSINWFNWHSGTQESLHCINKKISNSKFMSSRSPHVGLGPAFCACSQETDARSLGRLVIGWLVVCRQRAATRSGQQPAPTCSPICRLPKCRWGRRKLKRRANAIRC